MDRKKNPNIRELLVIVEKVVSERGGRVNYKVGEA